MKKDLVLKIGSVLALALASVLVANPDDTLAQDPQRQGVERKFEDYRKAIKDQFRVDVKTFKDRFKGGMADKKTITDYDLEQLLAGIKVEMEHTTNGVVALELAMDHLQRIPDYYSRVSRLEREAMSVEPQKPRKVEGNFEHYRKAIKDQFRVDIKTFKDKVRGGMADGKAITKYDLGELLEGIKWERQHANDSLIALELAMDHLERIPDYYSRLCRLEKECVSDWLLQH
ncbi:MAG: hypothetical protein HY695_17465 [Deltaproteobacteria bacterium]|nr:hypothetical protein [Deltaproteobacteria bacterium]